MTLNTHWNHLKYIKLSMSRRKLKVLLIYSDGLIAPHLIAATPLFPRNLQYVEKWELMCRRFPCKNKTRCFNLYSAFVWDSRQTKALTIAFSIHQIHLQYVGSLSYTYTKQLCCVAINQCQLCLENIMGKKSVCASATQNTNVLGK